MKSKCTMLLLAVLLLGQTMAAQNGNWRSKVSTLLQHQVGSQQEAMRRAGWQHRLYTYQDVDLGNSGKHIPRKGCNHRLQSFFFRRLHQSDEFQID